MTLEEQINRAIAALPKKPRTYIVRTKRPKRAGGKRRWAVGSKVQSLLFPRSHWTEGKAKTWAKRHGYRYGDVDVTDNYIRLRQFPPSALSEMRTICFGKRCTVKAVVGPPR